MREGAKSGESTVEGTLKLFLKAGFSMERSWSSSESLLRQGLLLSGVA